MVLVQMVFVNVEMVTPVPIVKLFLILVPISIVELMVLVQMVCVNVEMVTPVLPVKLFLILVTM